MSNPYQRGPGWAETAVEVHEENLVDMTSPQGIPGHLRLVLREGWQEGDCLRGDDAHPDADEEDCLVAQLHIRVGISSEETSNKWRA